MDQDTATKIKPRRLSYKDGIKKKKKRLQRSGRLKRMKNVIERKSSEVDCLKLSNKSLEKEVDKAVTDQKRWKRLVRLYS